MAHQLKISISVPLPPLPPEAAAFFPEYPSHYTQTLAGIAISDLEASTIASIEKLTGNDIQPTISFQVVEVDTSATSGPALEAPAEDSAPAEAPAESAPAEAPAA